MFHFTSHISKLWLKSFSTKCLSVKYCTSMYELASLALFKKSPRKISFMGNDDFSVASLSAIYRELDGGGCVSEVQVITGRPVQGRISAVEAYSRSAGLPVLHWPVTADQVSDCHIGVVVSFGHLIPAALIKAFPLGVLNVHGSVLPSHRGAAPVIHAVLAGDACTGVTVMRIHPRRFDVGEIVRIGRISVGRHTKSGELRKKLAKLGAVELIHVLADLPTHYNNATPQPTRGVSQAPKLSPTASNIDWDDWTASALYRRHLALDDVVPLYTAWRGDHVTLRGALVCPPHLLTASVASTSADSRAENTVEQADDLNRNVKNVAIPIDHADDSNRNVKNISNLQYNADDQNMYIGNLKSTNHAIDPNRNIHDNMYGSPKQEITSFTANSVEKVIQKSDINNEETLIRPGFREAEFSSRRLKSYSTININEVLTNSIEVNEANSEMSCKYTQVTTPRHNITSLSATNTAEINVNNNEDQKYLTAGGEYLIDEDWDYHSAIIKKYSKRINNKNAVKVPSLLPGQLAFNRLINILWVGCSDGSVVGFTIVKLANRKQMSAKDFHNGFLSKVDEKDLFFKYLK